MDAAAPAAPIALPSFDGTLGALEIGIVGCAFLFGIVTVQVYIYNRTYPEDSRFIKLMVGAVWLLELGHTIATAHAVYIETIKKFGNPALLATMPNSLAVSILMEGLVTFFAEGFFTYRIFIMYPTPFIAFGLWFLVFLRLVASTSYFIICFIPVSAHELFDVFEHKWSWLVETIQILGAVIDVLIALALCTYYLRHSDTTFASTKKLIDKLIMWAISTGLMTSLISVLTVIFFLTMKNNLAWIVLYIWLAKVYSNSLLATLNARHGMREAGKHGVYISGLSTTKNQGDPSLASAQFAPRITVETDTFVLDDRTNSSRKYPSLNDQVSV